MTRPTHRDEFRELIVSSTISRTDCDLAVVERQEKAGVRRETLYPVLGMHHRIVEVYRIRCSAEQPDPPSHLTLVELETFGGVFVERKEQFGVIFLHPRFSSSPVSTLDFRLPECKYAIFPSRMEWPPSEEDRIFRETLEERRTRTNGTEVVFDSWDKNSSKMGGDL